MNVGLVETNSIPVSIGERILGVWHDEELKKMACLVAENDKTPVNEWRWLKQARMRGVKAMLLAAVEATLFAGLFYPFGDYWGFLIELCDLAGVSRLPKKFIDLPFNHPRWSNWAVDRGIIHEEEAW